MTPLNYAASSTLGKLPIISTLPNSAVASDERIAPLAADMRRAFDADFEVVDFTDDAALAERLVRMGVGETAPVVVRAGTKRRFELVRLAPMQTLVVLPLADFGEPQRVAVAKVEGVGDAWLARTVDLFLSKARTERRVAQLEQEAQQLSKHIGATFEEITLIHRLTQNLSISQKPTMLGLQALEWLLEVVPAQGLALLFNTTDDDELFRHDDLAGPAFLIHGQVPVGADRFARLLDKVDGRKPARPVIINHGIEDDAEGEFADVREFVVVAVYEGERQFGWLAAFNHSEAGEFGTVEANLLSSVGTILGIHSGNIDLYRQQSDLFGSVVRAMSSAIDAKDPYTRGHSDRVARVSSRLAQELKCDDETIRTIYLGGLLHDIGKIGIDDGVLRKPGKLTDAEYEHIKTHVEIGYRILRGLRKMGHVLPIVLHHHEAWDGSGYPFGLAGTNIPFLARIVAVADAYDAMSSDRPYRKGMEDAKLDGIFRTGAGKQWDPDVVEAFFAARDDIRAISQREPDPIDAVSVEWTH
jgi:putative nucleotidyltransferase with HDIG domain